MSELFVQGVFTGFRRGPHTEYPHTALVHLESINSLERAKYYVGKKCVFIYPNTKKTVTGTVVATHGNSGSVRCKFEKNLCPKFMGKVVRVFVE